MTIDPMDPVVGEKGRLALVEHVAVTSPIRRRQRWWWIGVGVFAGVGLIGGVGATAAGSLIEPGADIVTGYGNPVTGTYTGSHTIELGGTPDSATSIMVELTCLSGGIVYLPDGTGTICPDLGAGMTSRTPLTLSAEQDSLEVRTSDPTVGFHAHIIYTGMTPTEWAVNENSDTYGATNTRGEPDLISVMTTEGRLGYIYADQLSEASGRTAAKDFTSPAAALAWQEEREGTAAMIAIYESDGQTVIGEFEAGRW
ncbi:hypothetical protein C4K88_00175 [Arthrobacter pityocampae]|uniref:Uncharacterized protein n=1 Tax=Arthrobacter pityocampae TaxID=547334 RepID=A0A2S5J0P8_9MICC|nr:hypothetical protein [Arthrobacter pityocampae]PPB50374.1 hypothetical protein C4K88_00175 [Arthrobacter pityocampae]